MPGGDCYSETGETFPREPWFATRQAEAFGIVLDADGKIVGSRADIDGASDLHLAGLRADGVSYIFAGTDTIDLASAVDRIARELDVKTLLVEGGGTANGAFLRAGLIDEISVAICPAIDVALGRQACSTRARRMPTGRHR